MEKLSDLSFKKQLLSRSDLNLYLRETDAEQSNNFSELQRNNQNHLTFWGGREE